MDYKLIEQRLDETETGQAAMVTLVDAKRPASLPENVPAHAATSWLGLSLRSGGLVWWDVFDALLSPGNLILLTSRRTHNDAEADTRDMKVPDGARVRRVRIVRDNGMFDRREAPQYYAEVKRETAARLGRMADSVNADGADVLFFGRWGWRIARNEIKLTPSSVSLGGNTLYMFVFKPWNIQEGGEMKTRGISTTMLAAAVTLCALCLNQPSRADAAGKTVTKVVDSQGNLRVPANYRFGYQYLGSWAIAADAGAGSKGMHQVYASPGAIAAFRKEGHFPDGTVLVKEVYETSTGSMTTGTVSHIEKLKGWFVMVKDSKDSHAGNALWGNGWGWSWFDADKPLKTTSTDFKKDCLSCHVPAKDTDWIYTQGYPVLKQ